MSNAARETPGRTPPPPQKTLGILTSGGDCAGLNAVVRAVVARAIQGYGWRVYGIHHGTMGLLRRPLEYEELDLRISTVNILRLGGTILGTTNKGNPFEFPMPDGRVVDRSTEVIDGIRQLEIDGLIGVGGDGSFKIIRRLAQQGEFKPGRHPQNDRQRYRRDGNVRRIRHRCYGCHRGTRSAAAHRGKP